MLGVKQLTMTMTASGFDGMSRMKRLTMALTSRRESSGTSDCEAEPGACGPRRRSLLAFGRLTPRDEATQALRIGAMIVEEIMRGLHSAGGWGRLLSASAYPPPRLEGAVTLPRDLGTYPTRVSYRIPPQGICIR